MVGHYWTIFGKDHGLRSGFVFVFFREGRPEEFQEPHATPMARLTRRLSDDFPER